MFELFGTRLQRANHFLRCKIFNDLFVLNHFSIDSILNVNFIDCQFKSIYPNIIDVQIEALFK